MIPSKVPTGVVVDSDPHKPATRPTLTSPQSLEDREASAAALARSLVERMQETYPFAPSPAATQVHPQPRDGNSSFRLDVIMNASFSDDSENHSGNSEGQLELEPSSGGASGKSSLAFILGNRTDSSRGGKDLHRDDPDDSEDGDWVGSVSSDASTDHNSYGPRAVATGVGDRSDKAPARRRSSASSSNASRSQVKKSRICKFDGCTRYVVNRGLCIGHGGGKRCATPGCTSSAKNLGVCWKHGGSTKCTVPGCDNRAKSRGVCWTHGGGKNCTGEGCTKTAVSHGLCWAHGGGKRCVVDGCKKPAYERNGNLCSVHHQQQQARATAA